MTALAPLLLTTLLKGTVILAMALALAAALRRAPGLARHRLWSLAFTGLLLLPALVTALPTLPLPVPAPVAALGAALLPSTPSAAVGVDATQARRGPAARSVEQHGAAGRTADRSTAATDQPDSQTMSARHIGDTAAGSSAQWANRGADERLAATTPPAKGWMTSLIGRHGRSTLLLVWLAGVAVGLAFLLAGVARAAWHAGRARPVDDEDWLRDLEWHRNFFGIRRRVRLLESEQVRTPMTGGVLRPMVLVPRGVAAWSAERRRLVLLHELVHIRRWDVVRHWLARVGVALYWFHPLAWLAARSSSVAREQACDEEVVRLGVKPSVYARQLFELAQGIHSGRPPVAALPMIQRSQLEIRLMAILDPQTKPRSARASTLAAVLMVLTAVSAAMAVPQEQPAPLPEPSVSPSTPAPAASLATPAAALSAPTAAPSTPAAVLSMPATAPAPAGGPALAAQESSACWPYGEERTWQRFSGSISTSDRDGIRRIEAAGTADGQRIVQQWIDDLRLCMRASGNVALNDDGSVGAVGNGGNLILEAELDGRLQSLTIHNDGNGEQLTWTVNGAARQVDQQVERWRDQMMTVLNEQARISTLRGRRSSLRGQISSIRGQRSSLRGQISSIRGQRSSLRGQISSIHGRQSSLNGEISSAHGHVSSLRGQISSARGQVSSWRGQISTHRGAIRSLQASRYGASEEELAVIEAAQRRHEEAIAEIERRIEDYDLDGRVAEIERRIEEYDLEGKIAEIESRRDNNLEAEIAEVERQIEALDVEGKVAEIEQQIEDLDVEGKVAEIEAQIEALHVDERVQEIEQRLEPALRQLRDTIESIR